MMPMLNKLTDVYSQRYFVATCVYVSVQTWGLCYLADSNVFETREEALGWAKEQTIARACVSITVEAITPNCTAKDLHESCIQSLRTEKEHVRDRMQHELEEYDDRIHKLLAISHQPSREEDDYES